MPHTIVLLACCTEWLNQGLEVQGQDQGLTFKAKARTKDSTRKAKNRTKDWRFKAKARTKDFNFVLKDNQGPRTKAKDNIPGENILK